MEDPELVVRTMLLDIELAARALDGAPWWSLLASAGLLLAAATGLILLAVVRWIGK